MYSYYVWRHGRRTSCNAKKHGIECTDTQKKHGMKKSQRMRTIPETNLSRVSGCVFGPDADYKVPFNFLSKWSRVPNYVFN